MARSDASSASVAPRLPPLFQAVVDPAADRLSPLACSICHNWPQALFVLNKPNGLGTKPKSIWYGPRMGGKQTKRQRRRESIEAASEVLEDHELGVRVELTPRGGYLVQWRSKAHPVDQLMGLERVRAALADIEQEVVLAARVAEGFSWEEIGWCLGITAEAARRRHVQAEREILGAEVDR